MDTAWLIVRLKNTYRPPTTQATSTCGLVKTATQPTINNSTPKLNRTIRVPARVARSPGFFSPCKRRCIDQPTARASTACIDLARPRGLGACRCLTTRSERIASQWRGCGVTNRVTPNWQAPDQQVETWTETCGPICFCGLVGGDSAHSAP